MKAPYRAELAALPATYASALRLDVNDLRAAISALGAGSAVFVGSGGSMVLALLAARLHENVWRQSARAVTSLELLDLPQLERRGACLFSSSAKHPDAHRVLAAFRRGRFSPTVVLTHREAEDLESLTGRDTRIVTLEEPAQRDGFLATGSILQMATVLLRAYVSPARLPVGLEAAQVDEPPLRQEVLVLTSPALASVAADLEVRLVESGLASVQVADYRNFAHGRHTGFARRSGCTTVIALSDSGCQELATETSGVLPTTVDLRRWHADGPWEHAVLFLLSRSMRLAGSAGECVGVDVARPAVPTFGRRLYRLPLRGWVPHKAAGGVERKLLAAGGGDDVRARATYEQAAQQWSADLEHQRFTGLVVDYDGTVCWTQRRWELPDAALRVAMQQLLDRGMVIGFASGRGRSLHSDLRQWVSAESWERVVVGLYNGAIHLGLNEELHDLREPTAWSSAVVDALQDVSNAAEVAIEERGRQVSLSVVSGALCHGVLAAAARARLEMAQVRATVVASGHSIDIIESHSSKGAISREVEERAGGAALTIGDQGQLGGNDYELLKASSWTLSVDRCSADPRSCWFAGSGADVGPDLLLRYLRALRPRGGVFAVTGLAVS